MEISERIEKLKPYLILYNVTIEDGIQYGVLRVPENWSIPAAQIEKAYDVKVRPMNGGVCFLATLDNNNLFNALEYAVNLNVKMEEIKPLLNAKIKELQEIFIREDIEKLKTLEFTFPPQKKTGKGGKKTTGLTVAEALLKPMETKTEAIAGPPPAPDDAIMGEAVNAVPVEEPVNEGDSLMEFAENAIKG